MPATRISDLIETRSAGLPAIVRAPRLAAWNLLALPFCAASLPGCGAAVWEQARGETDEAAREAAAPREAPEGPRFSVIRMIERPWLGRRDRRGR